MLDTTGVTAGDMDTTIAHGLADRAIPVLAWDWTVPAVLAACVAVGVVLYVAERVREESEDG